MPLTSPFKKKTLISIIQDLLDVEKTKDFEKEFSNNENDINHNLDLFFNRTILSFSEIINTHKKNLLQIIGIKQDYEITSLYPYFTAKFQDIKTSNNDFVIRGLYARLKKITSLMPKLLNQYKYGREAGDIWGYTLTVDHKETPLIHFISLLDKKDNKETKIKLQLFENSYTADIHIFNKWINKNLDYITLWYAQLKHGEFINKKSEKFIKYKNDTKLFFNNPISFKKNNKSSYEKFNFEDNFLWLVGLYASKYEEKNIEALKKRVEMFKQNKDIIKNKPQYGIWDGNLFNSSVQLLSTTIYNEQEKKEQQVEFWQEIRYWNLSNSAKKYIKNKKERGEKSGSKFIDLNISDNIADKVYYVRESKKGRSLQYVIAIKNNVSVAYEFKTISDFNFERYVIDWKNQQTNLIDLIKQVLCQNNFEKKNEEKFRDFGESNKFMFTWDNISRGWIFENIDNPNSFDPMIKRLRLFDGKTTQNEFITDFVEETKPYKEFLGNTSRDNDYQGYHFGLAGKKEVKLMTSLMNTHQHKGPSSHSSYNKISKYKSLDILQDDIAKGNKNISERLNKIMDYSIKYISQKFLDKISENNTDFSSPKVKTQEMLHLREMYKISFGVGNAEIQNLIVKLSQAKPKEYEKIISQLEQLIDYPGNDFISFLDILNIYQGINISRKSTFENKFNKINDKIYDYIIKGLKNEKEINITKLKDWFDIFKTLEKQKFLQTFENTKNGPIPPKNVYDKFLIPFNTALQEGLANHIFQISSKNNIKSPNIEELKNLIGFYKSEFFNKYKKYETILEQKNESYQKIYIINIVDILLRINKKQDVILKKEYDKNEHLKLIKFLEDIFDKDDLIYESPELDFNNDVKSSCIYKRLNKFLDLATEANKKNEIEEIVILYSLYRLIEEDYKNLDVQMNSDDVRELRKKISEFEHKYLISMYLNRTNKKIIFPKAFMELFWGTETKISMPKGNYFDKVEQTEYFQEPLIDGINKAFESKAAFKKISNRLNEILIDIRLVNEARGYAKELYTTITGNKYTNGI